MKKKLIYISAGRSDFDRLYLILKEINHSKKADLNIFLCASYFNKIFKYDIYKIKKEFKVINSQKKLKKLKDTPSQTIMNLVNDISDLQHYVSKIKPDLIIIAGDRYDILSSVIISIPHNIPVIHFFGGAITEGASDELVRHAVTKMSHLHYVLLNDYKNRLLQMGEEKWRVKQIGMPNLNNKLSLNFKSKRELSNELKFDFNEPYALVTFHPVTLDLKNTKIQVKNLIKAIKQLNMNFIITYPNSDVKFYEIIKSFKNNFKNNKKILLSHSLGEKKYFNLMKYAKFILGNSSSGIVEASSFKLPVINLGDRQRGKFLPKNVINSTYNYKDILKAIKKIKTKPFQKRIKNMKNPYISKISYKKIAENILKIKIDQKLIKKKFKTIH